jgi:hypothetical protein
MKALIYVLALLLLCATAWAADWTQIGHSNDAILYVDRSSAQYNGSHVTYWSKQVYSTARQVRVGSDLKPYNTLVMQTDLDCANRTAQNLVARFYDSSGNIVTSIDTAQNSRPIVPDSGADWERRAVCR